MTSKEQKISQTLIVGLSGPSSSGKTTLARLLRGVFNIDASPDSNDVSMKLFILHEDDFYLSDKDIPVREVSSPEHGTRTVQDWDCVESISLSTLDTSIRHIKSYGTLPAGLESKEDKNTVGDVGVADDEVTALKSDVVAWFKRLTTSAGNVKNLTICILDGFLLFPPPPVLLGAQVGCEIDASSVPLLTTLYSSMKDVLDLKVFLPSSRQKTVDRRARRSGYVTMEGFWEDPPGYVEDVVWPNYKRDHAWMFKSGGNVDEGMVDRHGVWVEREGIVIGPGSGDVAMKEVLSWVVDIVKGRIENFLRGRS